MILARQDVVPAADARPIRVLFVVSRDAPTRYADLMGAFEGNGGVQVVFDRRRRTRSAADQLSPDRRSLSTDVALRTVGWAVIRYPL